MALLSTFIFCETTLKQINDLPEDLRLKFYEAVTNYGIYNIEPHFTGLENTIWISMKDIIDTTKAKRAVKQKAGKAGGEAKRDRAKNKRTKQGVAEDSKSKQDVASAGNPKQGVAEDSNPYQALPNGNVNDNVNDNVNGNGKEKEDQNSSGFAESKAHDSPPSHKSRKSKKPILWEREPENDRERIFKTWWINFNTLFERPPPNPSRKAYMAISPLLNKWLKTEGVESVIKALNNAMKDKFCVNDAKYDLQVLLSERVFGRLLLADVNPVAASPRHRIAADNVSQEKVSSYFKEAK